MKKKKKKVVKKKKKKSKKKKKKQMQRRDFKDAMNEMGEHLVAKLREHTELIIQKNKEQDDKILRLGVTELDMNHAKAVLYAAFSRLKEDFKPKDDKYDTVVEKVSAILNSIGK